MKDLLAQKLLVKVMQWTAAEIAAERPVLQALARFKYDEYQQFAPGMRFVESLALWLNQFDIVDRRLAYQLMKDRLIYIGQLEVFHLIETAFPDYIQPILIKEAAGKLQVPSWKIRHIITSADYRALLRQTLFLGLSDGARIDLFRRANPVLSNEQVWLTYEINKEKRTDLLDNLRKGLTQLLGRAPSADEARFRTVVLIDDFSASGLSYYRKDDTASYKGKISKVLKSIFEEDGNLNAAVNSQNVSLHILLYVATRDAIAHMEAGIQQWLKEHKLDCGHSVQAIQELPDRISLSKNPDEQCTKFLQKYFDPSIVDEHFKKGKHEKPYYGFDECGLPVVLPHNTPNNSLPILWFEDDRKYRGLFPRVSRHKQEI